MTMYDNKEVERLLNGKRRKGEEDLLMLQPDGTRACVGWELIKGFYLCNLEEAKDEENEFWDAYRELRK